MRVLLVAGLVATAAAITACGGGDDSPRNRVEAYIKHANAIQRDFAPEFRRANQAYVAFSRSQGTGDRAITELARARTDVRRARAEVARLRPPEQARTLHARLLRVLDMNVYFADETARLASYQRDSQAASAPVAAVDRRLRRELRGARTPGTQVGALDRFVAGLDRALARLRALDVPAVLAPQHDAHVARLSSTRTLAAKLRRALRAQQAGRVARLVRAFRNAGGTDSTTAALTQRALADYDRRTRRLAEANADVQREQARLDDRLG
jgi:hypothetical protein